MTGWRRLSLTIHSCQEGRSRRSATTGGIGLKIHPDLVYGNLLKGPGYCRVCKQQRQFAVAGYTALPFSIWQAWQRARARGGAAKVLSGLFVQGSGFIG